MTKNNRIKSIAMLLVFCIVLMGLYPFVVYAEEDMDIINEERIGKSGEQQEEAVDNGEFSTDDSTSTFSADALTATITHNESRYNTFVNEENSAQNLELTINISAITGVTNGEIIVSPQIGQGFLGASYPYFSYAEAQTDNWGIVSQVADRGDGTIGIMLANIAAPVEGTVTLVFEFNGENYNGKVSPNVTMMAPMAEIFIEHEYSHSIEGERVVSAARDGLGGEFKSTNIAADNNGEFVYFSGQRIGFSALIFQKYGKEMLLDENYANNYSIYAPIGTQFADFLGSVVETGQGAGVTLAENEVQGVPAGNYYVFTYALPNDSDNPSMGWGNPEGDSDYDYYTEIVSSIILPTVPSGTTQKVYSALSYKLACEPAVNTTTEEKIYKFSDTFWRNFRTPGEHFTLSGQTAVSSIENGSESDTAVRTGGGYYDNKSTGNYGNVPVENVKFVLRQGTSPLEPSKMNFDKVKLLVGRESENNLWPVFAVQYKITNTANPNLSRLDGPYSYVVSDNSSVEVLIDLSLADDVALGNNEYIDQIIVTPMGTEGNSRGTMPRQTSFAFEYSFKAWDGQVWPDANNTEVSSYNPVQVGWWVEYGNANGGVSIKPGNQLMVLYKEMGSFPIVQSTVKANAGAQIISDESEFVIKGYNVSTLGASNNWSDPVIVVSTHSGIKLFDYGQLPFENFQGTVIGNLTVEAISESENRSFYKITFPEGYKVVPAGGEPDFVFNLKARIPAGLSAGEYKLDIALSSKVGTKFLVDNPAYHNNALPQATSKGDFGLEPGQNYTLSNVAGYEQEGIIVANVPRLRLKSQARLVGGNNWSDDKYIPVSDGSQVEVKISAANQGNSPLGSIGFYTVIPFNGHTTAQGEISVGNAVLSGVQAYGGRIYYYIGNESVQVDDFSLLDQGWTENPMVTDVVRAVYISFENNDLTQENQYSAVIKYRVPLGSASEYNVYSQFFVMCSDLANSYRFASTSQVLSKDTYALQYTTAPEDQDAYNMPPNLSGSFGAHSSVSVRLSNVIPQKPHHQFVGWMDVLSNDIYYPNDIVSLSKTGRREIIFQGVFEPEPSSAVTLRFNSNGAHSGQIVPGEIQTVSGQIVQSPNISSLTKTGYRTTGRFYLLSGIGGEIEYWDFAQPVPNIGQVELFVEWEENPVTENFYTINFNVNGGNPDEKPDPLRVLEGNKAGALPSQLSRDGYAFVGWSYIAGDGNSVDFTSETVVSGNLEVYAVWRKTIVTVTVKTLKYNYNENWQQAVEESSKSVVLEYGKKFSVTPEDNEKYIFIENFSDLTTVDSVTSDMVINLRYQHETYSVKAVSHLDLEVLQKVAGGSKTVSVEKLGKLAQLKMSSNKDNKWKTIPREVDISSKGLDDLDLTILSSSYDNDILISCQWPNGQVAEVVVSIKVVDIIAPAITLNAQQRITFKQSESLPKNESELYKSLLGKGMKVEDNHDRKVDVQISYLEGGISDITWEIGEEYIIFVSAKDSSDNVLPPKAVVLSCIG